MKVQLTRLNATLPEIISKPLVSLGVHWGRGILLRSLLLALFILVSGCNNHEVAGGTATLVAPATPSSSVTLQPELPTAESTQAPQEITTRPADLPPTFYTYQVIATFPHDATAFTQGLLFDQGQLYEGTGLYGESTLRRVELTTGAVEHQIALPDQYFGEGITIANGQIYQLTWQEQTGFIYDKTTFEQLGEFSYTTQGWGLTFDGNELIMSDGSDQLFFLDPNTMAVVKQLSVSIFDATDQSRKRVTQINELEYIEGEIFANIWQTDAIVRIDPATGNVNGVINLSGLLPTEERTATTDVLNGIAYLPEGNRLFVTGKKWPTLFEIQLIQQ